VLSRARLGDDALLAHPPRQQRLPQCVVNLVRPCVAQVFTLDVDMASQRVAEVRGIIERRRSPREGNQVVVQLALEVGVVLEAQVGVGQFVEGWDERFRYEASTIATEVAFFVGRSVYRHSSSIPHQRARSTAGR